MMWGWLKTIHVFRVPLFDATRQQEAGIILSADARPRLCNNYEQHSNLASLRHHRFERLATPGVADLGDGRVIIRRTLNALLTLGV